MRGRVRDRDRDLSFNFVVRRLMFEDVKILRNRLRLYHVMSVM